MSQRPPLAGMRHVALFVHKFEACEAFYVDLLGMEVEWRPDNDNVYLCSGVDNVALHRAPKERPEDNGGGRLDHIGFICQNMDNVDAWYRYLLDNEVVMRTEPRTHRDGARSFYCEDPDGTVVQMIYHPPISDKV